MFFYLVVVVKILIVIFIRIWLLGVIIYFCKVIFSIEVFNIYEKFENFNNLGITSVYKSVISNSYLFVFINKMSRAYMADDLHGFVWYG